ncbi:MAG: 1-acyl-sn-glycerol-3-phosphate acyltransferase [Clostridia bacterium]|nr:1-acyl-sn-glycerol-3-phosphate acyltransferase [Clostridia bacterium]
MAKNKVDNIKDLEIKAPNAFAYMVLSKLTNIRFKPKYFYDFDQDMTGKQVIVIADHAAWDSFYYVMAGYKFNRLNPVVGYHHVFKRFMYTFLLKVMHAIPKKNYQQDMVSMKQMLKAVKNGRSLLIFPEGTQSKSGSNVAITPSTAGFLKKLGLPVVLCKSYGSYLARPLWKDKTCKGHQEFHYQMLFTPDELSKLDKDAIYDKMLSRFRYNDFNWNKDKGYEYLHEDGSAKGLEKILFVCPKCKGKYTMATDRDSIYCSCGMKANLDSKFNLTGVDFKSVDSWYKDQRKYLDSTSFVADIYELNPQKLSYDLIARSDVNISSDGVSMLDMHIPDAASMLATPGKFNILYQDNKVYKIVPVENKNIVIENMLTIEKYYQEKDPVWAKVLKDSEND